MNTPVSFDPTNAPPIADLNAVSVTGMLIQDPELLIGGAGELVAVVVLAVEGRLQASAWGTTIRHTYFIHAWGLGPIAEWLPRCRLARAFALWGRWTISIAAMRRLWRNGSSSRSASTNLHCMPNPNHLRCFLCTNTLGPRKARARP